MFRCNWNQNFILQEVNSAALVQYAIKFTFLNVLIQLSFALFLSNMPNKKIMHHGLFFCKLHVDTSTILVKNKNIRKCLLPFQFYRLLFYFFVKKNSNIFNLICNNLWKHYWIMNRNQLFIRLGNLCHWHNKLVHAH